MVRTVKGTTRRNHLEAIMNNVRSSSAIEGIHISDEQAQKMIDELTGQSNKRKVWLGADPGAKGALCYITEASRIHFIDWKDEKQMGAALDMIAAANCQ